MEIYFGFELIDLGCFVHFTDMLFISRNCDRAQRRFGREIDRNLSISLSWALSRAQLLSPIQQGSFDAKRTADDRHGIEKMQGR